jgi:intracellular sulfur oxidation DsrE/DsrF family protein
MHAPFTMKEKTMPRALLPALASLALAACISVNDPAPVPARPSYAGSEMKIAFDVTEGNPKALLGKLSTIEVTRQQLLDRGVSPRLVIAFRGDASYFTNTDLSQVKEADRADAAKIAAKIRELQHAGGVEAVEQCNLPLAARKLKATEVMPEVKVVPNGWISLVGYQQQGYAYIVP